MTTNTKRKKARAMLAIEKCERWIIYLRVSVDKRGKVESPVEQLEEVLEWLPEIARPDTLPTEADLEIGDDAKGGVVEWENLLIIVEVCSASRYAKKARVWWPSVLAAMETGEYRGVVTWETSRSTRMLEDYTTYRSLLELQGMWYIASEMLYDITNPDHARMLGQAAVDAEIESMKTSKRTTRSVRAKARKGRPFGMIPFGFAREYAIEGGKSYCVRQYPDPTNGPTVRSWADRILAGTTTISQLSRESGRLRTSIVDTLTSPTTAGKRIYHEELFDAEWDGIVTWDEHLALCRILKDPSRNSRGHVDGGRQHPFTGVVECGKCGKSLYHRKHPNGPRYSCTINLCMSVVKRHVDEWFLIALQEAINERTAADLGGIDDTEPERLALELKLVDLDRELDEIVAALRAQDMSPKLAGMAEEANEAERKVTQTKLDKLAAPIELDSLNGVDVMALWKAEDWNQLHEIATRLLHKVVIAPAETGGPVFNRDRIKPDWR